MNPEEEVTLTANVTAGAAPFTYDWTGPNGFAATGQTPTLPNTNNVSGTYIVTVTDANGCFATAETTIDATVRPDAPILSTTGPVCLGDPLMVAAIPVTGVVIDYEWTGPAGSTTGGAYPNSQSLVFDPTDGSDCLLYTSPSPRDRQKSRMPSSA